MDDLHTLENLLAVAVDSDDHEAASQAESRLFLQLRARILPLVQQRIWNSHQASSELRKDAEDLTTDICLVILRRYKTAGLHHGFMLWVMQIVRNKIGQFYRERNRRKGKKEPLPDENNTIDNDPEAELEGRELDGIIFRALKEMGQPCAKIIEALLAGEIKTYMEERQRTTPLGTIYNQIHRCRESLKNVLREKGYTL